MLGTVFGVVRLTVSSKSRSDYTHTLDLIPIPARAEGVVEAIAKALVDNPDQVQVRAIEGEEVILFELRVHPSDLGKVIGCQGRTVDAIRTS